jgi:hypothetical protein
MKQPWTGGSYYTYRPGYLTALWRLSQETPRRSTLRLAWAALVAIVVARLLA